MNESLVAALIGSGSSLLGVLLKHHLEMASQNPGKVIQTQISSSSADSSSSLETLKIETAALPSVNCEKEQAITLTTPKKLTCRAANLSLGFGIGSILLIGFLAVPAIVSGHLALERIHVSNGSLVGKARAITGMAIGYLVLIGLLAIIIFGT